MSCKADANVVRVEEIDSNGKALVWVGDLLNIAQELLTEFDHPDTLGILKKVQAPQNWWPVSTTPVHWFIGKMNALNNGYTYTGSVQASSAVVNTIPNTTFNKEVVLGHNNPTGDETR